MAGKEGHLSPVLFQADFSGRKNRTRKTYELTTAEKVEGFKEDWLQRAIVDDVELVLAPCRAAGLIAADEKWKPWARPFSIREAGGISIDVLLLSEFGRIGIVETKLAYNPEARRTVVAQVLEYAIHLPSVPIEQLPDIPPGDGGKAFVDRETAERKLEEGDYLLIIAGDQLEPRAIKLGRSLLDKHMIYGWDLALVEVAIFEQKVDSGKSEYLLVPHLCGALAVEGRQVFRVVIDENRTRVEVERTIGPVIVNRQKWDEERFFAEAARAAPAFRKFVENLRLLRDKYSDVTFEFGTGAIPTLKFFRGDHTFLIFSLDGTVAFHTSSLSRALGKESTYYQHELKGLFPVLSMERAYTTAELQPDTADPKLSALLDLLKEVLARLSSEPPHSQAVPAP